MVARLDAFTFALVFLGVRFGIFDHLLDLLLRKPTRSRDSDRLFFPSAKIFGIDVNNAVGIDVKGDLNLRHTARRRGNTNQIKLSEHFVGSRHLTLTLEDADRYRGLTVSGGREDLALLGRNSSVLLDQPCEHST